MKRPLKVLFANERFLPRFGVDRILLRLANHLAEQGGEIQFVCLRCERSLVEPICNDILEIKLPEGLDIVGSERFATEALFERWQDESTRPDVVIVGGWPFFTLAARTSALGIPSIFIDAGAVPHDGFPEAILPAQLDLRRLRHQTMPHIGKILPISDFIRTTQTDPERGDSGHVRTVHLGADHIPVLEEDIRALPAAEQLLVQKIDRGIKDKARHILLLGRYEAFGYKNSSDIFDFIRDVCSEHPHTRLVLLAGGEKLDIPKDLQGAVIAMPSISDGALNAVMRRVDLGVSLSTWEGFNLPIAEMQILRKPALAFNRGAHPEIIAHPWLLCETIGEMQRKARELLRADNPMVAFISAGFERFAERFTWAQTLSGWTQEIVASIESAPKAEPRPQPRLVLIDVSNSCRDPGNSGVIRVTRRLTAELASDAGLRIVFITWDAKSGGYVVPSREASACLGTNGGPTHWIGDFMPAGPQPLRAEVVLQALSPLSPEPPVVFLPEVILDGTTEDRVAWARKLRCKVAFILYDMLPIYATSLIADSVREAFPAYIRGVTSSDAVWGISEFSMKEFEKYAQEQSLNLPAQRSSIWLPGQFGDQPRRYDTRHRAEGIHILMVSTLEPRKNHATLIEAFQIVRNRRPGLDLQLHLVGNNYPDGQHIVQMVEDAAAADPNIHFHGLVDDATIASLYQKVSFTVYSSVMEGFGLPVLETLWMGRPCICSQSGVMAELAAGGGCITVDILDCYELASAIERLATDRELLASLARVARRRTIDTWSQYARKVARQIARIGVEAL